LRAQPLALAGEPLQQEGMYAEPASMQPRQRIPAIDLARGAALLAMAIYHFTWDLEFFGYADPGMTAVGGWRLFARCIASSFLFLAGVSLVLGHGKGIRWQGFLRRLAMVGGAALAISLVTYLAVPGGFIFFGILHQIALASVLGLLFLRLPAILTLAVAAAVIAAPHFLRSPVFDHPAWWWLGLSSTNPRSNDYVPLFPWFGAVLAGIAAARIGETSGLFERLADIALGKWSRPAILAGQHSLAVYLVHQPVLIACVWLFSQAFPAQVETPEVQFRNSCERTCQDGNSEEFCAFYCVCVLDGLARENMLDSIFSGEQSDALRDRVQAMAAACTAETEEKMSGGAMQ
jgi:uncharacterized membrane protein